MPIHRSIVRIPRNANIRRSANVCGVLSLYILANMIFYKYWYVINGTTIAFLCCCGGGVLCYVRSIDVETDSDPDGDPDGDQGSDTCTDMSSDTSSDNEFTIDIPSIMAYPVPESILVVDGNVDGNDEDVSCVAVRIEDL